MVFVKREWGTIQEVKEVMEGIFHFGRIGDLAFYSRTSHFNVVTSRLSSRWSDFFLNEAALIITTVAVIEL